MRRRVLLLALAAGLGLALMGLTASASTAPPSPRQALIERMLSAAAGLDGAGGATSNGQPAARATRELGELNLSGGLNADV